MDDVTEIVLKVKPRVNDAELSVLHHRAFNRDSKEDDISIIPWVSRLERHSLTWIGAYKSETLVGFVNAVWDGGKHAFILDTVVHPDFQRSGIGRKLVNAVTEETFRAGCEWVHVDYDPEYVPFYENGCGFTPTPAGLRSSGPTQADTGNRLGRN